MKSMLLWLPLVLFSWAGAQQFDASSVPTAPTPDLKGVKIDQRLGFSIPADDELVDPQGRAVRLGEYLHSRPLLVMPIFYRCAGVCSLEMNSVLAAVQKMPLKVGRDFDVVVISIDPQEGPKEASMKFDMTMAAAPALKQTASGWHFLTGKLDQILAVTDALGFHYTYQADKDLINHPSGLMIVTSDGRISSYVLGASYSPQVLTHDLELAKTSKVGAKVPDVFFGCVHIDPLTGRRSIVIEAVLRLAALTTVIAIVGGVGILSIGKARRRGIIS